MQLATVAAQALHCWGLVLASERVSTRTGDLSCKQVPRNIHVEKDCVYVIPCCTVISSQQSTVCKEPPNRRNYINRMNCWTPTWHAYRCHINMKLHSTQSRPNVVRCISRERRAQAWAMMAYQDCRRFQTRHLQMCLLHTMDMDIRSSCLLYTSDAADE